MEALTSLIYVSGDTFATVTNIVVFVAIIEFFSLIVSYLSNIGK